MSNRNYINLCRPCDLSGNGVCQTCEQLKEVKKFMLPDEFLGGTRGREKYELFNLREHGFTFLPKDEGSVLNLALLAHDEISRIENDEKYLKFLRIGQNEGTNNGYRYRMETDSSTLQGLSNFIMLMKERISKKLHEETGEEYHMNEFTILKNSKNGVGKQLLHMDENFACSCG